MDFLKSKRMLAIGVMIAMGGIFFFHSPTCCDNEVPLITPDGIQYVDLGSNMVKINSFSLDGVSPSARREVLYPFIISLFVRSGAVEPFSYNLDAYPGLQLLQLVVYFVAVFLLALMAIDLSKGNVFAGWLVLLLATFWGSLVGRSFLILSENLTFFLVGVAFYFIYRWSGSKRDRDLYLSAIFFGILGILKSAFIPFPVVLAIIIFFHRTKISAIGIFLVISMLPTSMWLVRNYVVMDEVILSTTDGASSFYRGNLILNKLISDMDQPEIPQEVRDKISTMSTQGEIDDYLLGLAKKRIADAPMDFVLQLVHKARLLLIGAGSRIGLIFKIFVFLLILSHLPELYRKNQLYFLISVSFALFVLAIYTLIYGTARYYLPIYFLFLPIVSDAFLGWVTKARRLIFDSRPPG